MNRSALALAALGLPALLSTAAAQPRGLTRSAPHGVRIQPRVQSFRRSARPRRNASGPRLTALQNLARTCVQQIQSSGVGVSPQALTGLLPRLVPVQGCKKESKELGRLLSSLEKEVRDQAASIRSLTSQARASSRMRGSLRAPLSIAVKTLATVLGAVAGARDQVQQACAGSGGEPTPAYTRVPSRGPSSDGASRIGRDLDMLEAKQANDMARAKTLAKGCTVALEVFSSEIAGLGRTIVKLERSIADQQTKAFYTPFPLNVPVIEKILKLKARLKKLKKQLKQMEREMKNACRSIKDDCIPFRNSRASLAPYPRPGKPTRWRILAGKMALKLFPTHPEAQVGLSVMKKYKLNQQCFVGRPRPSLEYYLTSGKPPTGSMPGEDCIPFNRRTLKVQRVKGSWKLVDKSHWVADFGSKYAEANKALEIIVKHRFDRVCYVGRPGPSMTYLRR